MQIPGWIRGAASACALGIVAGPMASSVAYAAPTATPTPTPKSTATASASPSASATPSATPTRVATAKATPADQCTDATKLTILSFNDFHGRIAASAPDTVGFFGDIEQMRTAAGADNTLLLSNGDNIGGSLFTSASQDDNPTLDILNAAKVDVSSVGNHEYDKGQNDFNTRVRTRAQFPYLAANITGAGAPEAYKVFTKAGVRVAVIGAVTSDLPSLVSPAGMTGLTVGDPVDAVNRYADQLRDGDETNGEADIVIAAYHEGAAGSGTYATEAGASAMFKKIAESTSPKVAAIYNAHTHQTYAYDVSTTGGQRPVMQSGSYGSLIGKVELGIDATNKSVVNCYTKANVKPVMTAAQAVSTFPATMPQIKTLVDNAIAQSKVIGAQVIGSATAPVTRAVATDRNRESQMSNLVAQMFKDQLGKNDPNFIGLQNPGGTRADFDAGDITYEEAASILPFANSLMTTEVTGAQLKKVFEQQWQRDKDNKIPSRPYLQLGVSQNVTVAYDESRPEGDRITSIFVSNKPLDLNAKYTVGSGSFLIAGGDNFWELGKGTNTKDTGRVDLEAFVDYIRQIQKVSPDDGKQFVSVKPVPREFTTNEKQTFAVGVPAAGGVAPDTLNLTGNNTTPVPNTELVAAFTPDGGQPVVVGRAPVVDGKVAAIDVTFPNMPAGPGVLRFIANPNITVAQFPVMVKSGAFCGLKDNGCYRPNPNGGLTYWSDKSPAATVKGAIYDKYAAMGWENSPLGYPMADEVCGLKDGGCFQKFQGGSIYWSQATGAHQVWGAIHDKWGSLRFENGYLGYPTSDERCGLKNGGCFQTFQGGAIYYSPATGAHVVRGALAVAWEHVGWENGPLGYPMADEMCGLKNGGCSQRFEGGVAMYSPATGAHAVFGAIYGEYQRLGWENSPLGYPTGNEFCGLKDGGCGQHFQNNTHIYWSPKSGAHPVWGLIGEFWASKGWENSRYGYPVAAETCTANGCSQAYQGGTINWAPARGVW